MIKLNIGCGSDYRNGFINIDGSSKVKTDKIIDLNNDSLMNHFVPETIDYILANDIVEHFFHWEAINLLTSFFNILKKGGTCEIRVPDAEFIIESLELPIEGKLNLLFGGQDIPQRVNPEMDMSRKKYPQFFCHKYGWIKNSMEKELLSIGFTSISFSNSGTDFIAISSK